MPGRSRRTESSMGGNSRRASSGVTKRAVPAGSGSAANASHSCWTLSSPTYDPIEPLARASSSWSAQGRTPDMPPPLQLLERRVLEHELALAAVVGEAHRDEAARLDPCDDALAERRVADRVAGGEVGDVLARRDPALARRVVARPRRRP